MFVFVINLYKGSEIDMKVVKKINNNCALCLDSQNKEVVAFGKGIGFDKPPYDIELNRIERVYYDIEESSVKMINDIPEEIIDISAKIIEYAKTKIKYLNNSNVIFTLADHINFAIKRYKEHIDIKLPIINDIQYLYDIEMEIGQKALELIRKILRVSLPDEEAIYIALHIINAETMDESQRNENFDEKVIDEIIKIIELNMNIEINKNGFNYSRFVTHLYYLLRRGKKNHFEVNEDNKDLYISLSSSFPQIYGCTKQIAEYFDDCYQWKLTDEECIYLILHINRLCNRETYDK